MKGFLILKAHEILFRLCGRVLPESLWNVWYDKVYAPWYAALPDACDDCPICQTEKNDTAATGS